jgi:hypothetical protein
VHQRALCSTGSPQYIIGLGMLKNMYLQLRKATQEYERLQMMTAAIKSQQGLTGPPSQFNAPNIPPSAQPTPSRTLIYHTSPSNSRSKILIPDLTALITRCSQDPVCGGTYGNIYRCIYHGPEGDIEVRTKVTVFFHMLLMYPAPHRLPSKHPDHNSSVQR